MTKEAPRQLFSGAVPGNFFGGFIRCVFVCFKVQWCFSKIAFYYEQVQKLLDILIKMIQIFHMKQTSIFVFFFGCSFVFSSWEGMGTWRSFFTFYILDPWIHGSESPLWEASSSWTNGCFCMIWKITGSAKVPLSGWVISYLTSSNRSISDLHDLR